MLQIVWGEVGRESRSGVLPCHPSYVGVRDSGDWHCSLIYPFRLSMCPILIACLFLSAFVYQTTCGRAEASLGSSVFFTGELLPTRLLIHPILGSEIQCGVHRE